MSPEPSAPAAEPTQAQRNQARRAFALAAFGSLLIPGILNAGVVPHELLGIREEFGLTEMSFGIIAASIAAVAVVLGCTAAWAIPRYGAYRVLLAGYFIFAVGMFGVILAPMGAVALLLGTCIAWGMAYLHQGNGLAVAYAPKRAAAMTNLLHSFNALGKAIGPTFALIGTTWREPFAALGAVAAVLGLAGLAGVGFERIHGGERDGGEAYREAPAREALRSPFFWCAAALFVPIAGMELIATLWLPSYLKEDAGLPQADGEALAVLATVTIFWSMCAMRFAAPWILKRVPPVLFLVSCSIGTLALLVSLELDLWSGPVAWASMALTGVGFSAAWPTFFALCCRYFPKHRGLLSIVSGAATTVAWISMSAVSGVVAYKYGLGWALRIAPMLAVFVIFGAVFVCRRGEATRAAAD